MKQGCIHRLDCKKERKVKTVKAANLKKENEEMSREEILNKLIFIRWINKGETCVYTRKIPSFIYPFAKGRKEGFADSLRIYIDKWQVYETLNDYFHREVTGKEAEEWREWVKKQKEEN